MKNNHIFKSSFQVNPDDIGEMITLIDSEEEDRMNKEPLPNELPILAVKNTVLFPGIVIPITVGRAKSIKLVKKAYKGDRTVAVLAQKNEAEDPTMDDLYAVGTVAKIIKMLVLPDGNTTIIIQGTRKFQLDAITQTEPYLMGKVSSIKDTWPYPNRKESKALLSTLREMAIKILRMNPDIPQEAQIALDNIESPSFLTHFLSSNINAEPAEKQRLLEAEDGAVRANLLLNLMSKEMQMLQLKNEIQSKVHHEVDQQQRDYFLRQQIKVLQDELGGENTEQALDQFRTRAKAKKWKESVAKQFNKELDKLGRMNPMAAEYSITMNYIELMLDLPWGELTKDNFNLKRARKVLDTDHYGLEKVKERIIEYLAVLKLKQSMKAPILLLYGPPGVGKTSLGRSVANALGRQYIRMSLGGLHDEAEIRGHRKTYVGAMPGRIVQNIKKAGSDNPVFILDEIDKIGNDFRGDPASALLEVLDPEQNSTFADNYLEAEYDLSKVMFIATCNSLDSIHPALRDRMEIIELTGYTQEEKFQIAKKHLISKQLEENGLEKEEVEFDNKALNKIIEEYTRESGVRNLEREIGKLLRKIATEKATNDDFVFRKIYDADVEELLGSARYDKELYQDNEQAGVVTGLAWTPVGGDILFIESILTRGRGKVVLSGQLGDVMKESAMAAHSYLKSNADKLGIDYAVFDNYDVHVHVPAGAVPKDGPSAGITMFTALASAFTQRKVRSKLAMTGEITLRGRVLPVGGIKEKILAAKRAGIKDIILCSKNRKDVEEINQSFIKDLKITYVDTVDEVLELAILQEKVRKPIDLSWRAAAPLGPQAIMGTA